jgi:hypothetical protein
MGGSHSKTTADIFTSAAASVMQETMMSCSGNGSLQQRVIVSGDYNVVKGVHQTATMKLSVQCAQKAKNVADLQQSVSNAIAQASKSQSVSVLGALGKSSSETNTKIHNDVKTAITQKSIAKLVGDVNATQELVVSGNHNIVEDISQNLTAQLLLKNSQTILNRMKSVQTLATAVKQKSSATQTNFISDIIDSIFKGVNGMMLIYVILIIGVAYMFGPAIISAIFGSDSEQPQQQQYQPQYQPSQQYQPPQQPQPQPSYQPPQPPQQPYQPQPSYQQPQPSQYQQPQPSQYQQPVS